MYIRISILTLALCLTAALTPAPARALDDELLVGVVSTLTTEIKPLSPKERDMMSFNALVYESLVTIDDSYQPQPCLAESWSTQGGKSWTFTLRENVFFHDGTRLMASDVAATITEILRLANAEGDGDKGVYANLKYFVSSVQVKDDRTLIIKTSSRAYYGFIYEMTFPILKASEVASASPVGTGPYRIASYQPGDMLWLTANTAWWKVAPKVTDVVGVIYPTQSALISGFEYGNVDAVMTRSTSAAQYRSGVNTLNLTYRTNQLETMLMNLKAFPLEDVNIRKAIRYAIDIDKLTEGNYLGMVERTDTPIAKSLWMYGVEDDAVVYAPDTARAMLAAAGWEDLDDDGILDLVVDGKTKHLVLRLYVYEETDNSVRVETANMISDMLADVGIKVNVTSMSFTEVKTKLTAGSYDLCLVAYQMDVSPDASFILMSSNTGNFCRYRSDTMDALCKNLRTALTQSDYLNAHAAVQRQFLEDCPLICLYYRTGSLLTRQMFTSVRDIRDGEVLRGVEAWTE